MTCTEKILVGTAVILLTITAIERLAELDTTDRGRQFCRNVYSALHKPDYEPALRSCTIVVAGGQRIAVPTIYEGGLVHPATAPKEVEEKLAHPRYE